MRTAILGSTQAQRETRTANANTQCLHSVVTKGVFQFEAAVDVSILDYLARLFYEFQLFCHSSADTGVLWDLFVDVTANPLS